uniref:Uncharacterized protein n=1 Tax=Glossina palpalis gambiensis TaxID=67801 RepID=A0A1B0B8X1_9MUSC
MDKCIQALSRSHLFRGVRGHGEGKSEGEDDCDGINGSNDEGSSSMKVYLIFNGRNENRECKDAVRTANEWLSQQVHTEVGKSINDNLIRIFHIKNISAMRLMVALATVTVIVVETIVEQKIN